MHHTIYIRYRPTGAGMRTTLNLDDALLEEARKLTGVTAGAARRFSAQAQGVARARRSGRAMRVPVAY
jgi:hypothetical protein